MRSDEQPQNENVLRYPMMPLDALLSDHFNGVSTEIVFGSIFKRNVSGSLIGNSAQVLDKISRLTWKSLRNYLNIFYVELQLDIKGSNSHSDIDELKNLKSQIEMQNETLVKKTTANRYLTSIIKYLPKFLIIKNKFCLIILKLQ